ncbi:MAG: hypothetical protein KGH84_10915 [Paracoccaceae bacterium]|nr:hypothetical protein [Paracoccaceae bacterium]
MTQKSSDPDAADLTWRRSFEADPVPEEELWFLPGPAEDVDCDPLAPPLPRADRRRAFVPVAWRTAQGDLAAELAQVATLFGALEERLRRLGQGARQRLALLEAAELSWHSGDRVAPDRLGMWVSLRLSNPQDEAQALSRAAWAVRRLSGGPGPEADLAAFLGRHDPAKTAGLGPAFGKPPSDLAGRLADWQEAMAEADGLHPIVGAALGFHLWQLGEISGSGAAADLEAAVVAARLAARAGVRRGPAQPANFKGVRGSPAQPANAPGERLSPERAEPRDYMGGALFLPLALAGPGALRRGGEATAILGRWLAGAEASCLAALLSLERLEAWRCRAEAATVGWSGRTPAQLIAVLADWPLVSAAMAETETGASRAAAQRNLDLLSEAGLIREVTGQGRFRLWTAKL